jgi:hypothetical protein
MFSRTLVLTSSAAALVVAGLASSPVVTTVEAQGRAVSRIRFQEMDKNNDGVVTRQEWNGSARSFDVHDWNGDGRLTGEEVRIGGRRNQEWDAVDHAPNWRERSVAWTRAGFANLDHNRDNRITSNEWHFDNETFRRVDINNDNALNLNEFLGEGVDDMRDDRFDDLDYNNNGRVERTEWYGGANEFNRLDANRDGILSRYEVVGSTENTTTYNEFTNLDYDKSGSLERAEWHWSNASFTARDTNRDGRITAAEFQTAGGSPATAGAQAAASQTVRVNSQMRWTDTGINVRAGDTITFNTQGQIQMSDNAADTAGAAGSSSRRMAKDAPISNVIAGALIGQIGAYPPFAVGDQRSIVAPVTGRLYLGVNDDHLPDNRGEFTVQVGVQRR